MAVTDSGGEAQLIGDHARALGFELPAPSEAMKVAAPGRGGRTSPSSATRSIRGAWIPTSSPCTRRSSTRWRTRTSTSSPSGWTRSRRGWARTRSTWATSAARSLIEAVKRTREVRRVLHAARDGPGAPGGPRAAPRGGHPAAARAAAGDGGAPPRAWYWNGAGGRGRRGRARGRAGVRARPATNAGPVLSEARQPRGARGVRHPAGARRRRDDGRRGRRGGGAHRLPRRDEGRRARRGPQGRRRPRSGGRRGRRGERDDVRPS